MGYLNKFSLKVSELILFKELMIKEIFLIKKILL